MLFKELTGAQATNFLKMMEKMRLIIISCLISDINNTFVGKDKLPEGIVKLPYFAERFGRNAHFPQKPSLQRPGTNPQGGSQFLYTNITSKLIDQ